MLLYLLNAPVRETEETYIGESGERECVCVCVKRHVSCGIDDDNPGLE